MGGRESGENPEQCLLLLAPCVGVPHVATDRKGWEGMAFRE